jgi:hypothetical protein
MVSWQLGVLFMSPKAALRRQCHDILTPLVEAKMVNLSTGEESCARGRAPSCLRHPWRAAP